MQSPVSDADLCKDNHAVRHHQSYRSTECRVQVSLWLIYCQRIDRHKAKALLGECPGTLICPDMWITSKQMICIRHWRTMHKTKVWTRVSHCADIFSLWGGYATVKHWQVLIWYWIPLMKIVRHSSSFPFQNVFVYLQNCLNMVISAKTLSRWRSRGISMCSIPASFFFSQLSIMICCRWNCLAMYPLSQNHHSYLWQIVLYCGGTQWILCIANISDYTKYHEISSSECYG